MANYRTMNISNLRCTTLQTEIYYLSMVKKKILMDSAAEGSVEDHTVQKTERS